MRIETTPPPTLIVNTGLHDMLRRCRDQFQTYGDNHMAKNPPQLDKAKVNYDLVAEINQTLIDALIPLPLFQVTEEMLAGLSNQPPREYHPVR